MFSYALNKRRDLREKHRLGERGLRKGVLAYSVSSSGKFEGDAQSVLEGPGNFGESKGGKMGKSLDLDTRSKKCVPMFSMWQVEEMNRPYLQLSEKRRRKGRGKLPS